MLLSIKTGLMANTANYGTYIGIFGGEVVTRFYLSATLIAALVTVFYIVRNIRRPGDGGSLAELLPALLRGLACSPFWEVFSAPLAVSSRGGTNRSCGKSGPCPQPP